MGLDLNQHKRTLTAQALRAVAKDIEADVRRGTFPAGYPNGHGKTIDAEQRATMRMLAAEMTELAHQIEWDE